MSDDDPVTEPCALPDGPQAASGAPSGSRRGTWRHRVLPLALELMGLACGAVGALIVAASMINPDIAGAYGIALFGASFGLWAMASNERCDHAIRGIYRELDSTYRELDAIHNFIDAYERIHYPDTDLDEQEPDDDRADDQHP